MPGPATAADLPFVRVVVLNWNSAWFTSRCLRSLAATDYPADRLEVVVVDNASIDGSRERLAHDFPGLRVVANGANLGFAEACNRALRDVATGEAPEVELVALVNNDATVDPGWLRPLVAAMVSAPDVGAACPAILLETPYVEVEVDPGELDLGGEVELVAARVDGIDVTRRLLPGSLTMSPHPTLPLEFRRRLGGRVHLGVPVDGRRPDAVARLALDLRGERSTTLHRNLAVADATVRVNSLGTDLTAEREGYEVGFGSPFDASTTRHEVTGWSGGGVLLRAAMLRDVGVFDPRHFAYYEDTDLAWRARRRGWRTVCEPASRLHHLHGGSAGATARPFFFLNYRNWLLTVLRNGTRAEVRAALRHARHLSWPYVRRNVTGRLRRLQRPDTTIAAAWGRVGAGTLAELPRVLRSRRAAAVGVEQTDDVVSRFMPAAAARPPAVRLGGPTLVYVDVTETLRSGWRAGIQRVTCELVRHLPVEAPHLEVVPVVWSLLHQRFRRVTADEYAALLAPTGRQRPAPKVPPLSPARRALGRLGARLGLTPIAESLRRRRALRNEPALHRQLLLDRLEPGSVFLDADATWNVRPAARRDLLPRLTAGGVRVVHLLYDVLPMTRPEWFEPKNAAVFAAHVDAHADHADLVLAISDDTAAAYRAWLTDAGRDVPPVSVVPLGAELPDADAVEDVALPAGLTGRPYLLAVGTVEPRKNHDALIEAYQDVAADHDQLHLVVVGRPGWRSHTTIDRLRRLASSDPRVHWLETATDAELEALYRDAFAVVAASHTEGFGLPVAEALARGRVVLASHGGALPEAGGDAAEYFDPGRPAELARLVRRHLDDPVHHAEREAIAASAPPRRWADLAHAVAMELGELGVVRPGEHERRD